MEEKEKMPLPKVTIDEFFTTQEERNEQKLEALNNKSKQKK